MKVFHEKKIDISGFNSFIDRVLHQLNTEDIHISRESLLGSKDVVGKVMKNTAYLDHGEFGIKVSIKIYPANDDVPGYDFATELSIDNENNTLSVYGVTATNHLRQENTDGQEDCEEDGVENENKE